ncbi:TetR family transcriptional regulator [Lysobacter sp. HX-5-24]|uniref:TetR family transcriptional regulator n=1 Tax=Noviluteimonas gilva TaxID=2682097 RepID=A0A7C9M361_9GAMM|nr:TetR family transcriptional regulator [Lysobacter gilvus]
MTPLPAKSRRKPAPKTSEVVETAELPAARGRKPGSRAVGRPTGEGGDLRARLLDVAVSCFARQGIAASTLREIAQEAGVNPALVHYYFGDKLQLQQAVISERLMPVFAEVRNATLQGGDDISSVIAGFVRGMCETVDKHPWLPPLWVREVLCEGGALRELLFTTMAPQMPQILAAKFAQAQADGQLNRELDPRLLVASLIGLTLFPAAGAPIWRRLFDADDIDAVAMKNHAIALLDTGIGVP